jgi:hypothetical protein
VPSRQRKTFALATEDSIDSSPDSSRHSEAPNDEETEQVDIEVKSSFVLETPPRDGEPLAKRRRVSVSPDLGAAPEIDGSPEAEDGALPESIEIELSQSQIEIRDQKTSSDCPSSPTDGAFASKGSLPSHRTEKVRQPAFLRPPQFQALEGGARPTLHPLPDAFSPRKHGAKFMSGGLAAELRDWLMGVKGSEEDGKLGVSEVRLIPDRVRAGSGMFIVHAHHIAKGSEQETVQILLAGAGRISGLAGPNVVKAGAMLVVAPPTWEIELDDLGVWTVACDWFTVLS